VVGAELVMATLLLAEFAMEVSAIVVEL